MNSALEIKEAMNVQFRNGTKTHSFKRADSYLTMLCGNNHTDGMVISECYKDGFKHINNDNLDIIEVSTFNHESLYRDKCVGVTSLKSKAKETKLTKKRRIEELEEDVFQLQQVLREAGLTPWVGTEFWSVMFCRENRNQISDLRTNIIEYTRGVKKDMKRIEEMVVELKNEILGDA